MNIVVGILSANHYQQRRQEIVDTWLPEIEQLGITVAFLIGDTAEGRNVLNLPCPDDYDSLPQKTRMFAQWVIDYTDADYLFKTDDDTYIHPQRFKTYADSLDGSADYIGVDPVSDETTPAPPFFASGGAGYFLSRKAAQIIATDMLDLQGAEDLQVARTLLRHGIVLRNDKRFGAWARNEITTENDQITTHYVSGAMVDIFKRLGNLKECQLQTPKTVNRSN